MQLPEAYPCLTFRIHMDTLQIMNTFHRTAEFDAWLSSLKDKIGKPASSSASVPLRRQSW